MKCLRKIVSICAVIAVLLLAMSLIVYATEYSDAKLARENFLRLHIRANSDSDEDQALKLDVRDALLDVTTELLIDVRDKDTAIGIVTENIDTLTETARAVIAEKGYDYDVKIYISNEFFDYREYDGFYLPEGYYDALVVEIGSGSGHNWWCVVFPAICTSGSVDIIDSSSSDKDSACIESGQDSSGAEAEDVKTENSGNDSGTAVPESRENVRVNTQLVPERFRIAQTPTPSEDETEIRYESWIYKTIRRLFHI